VRHKACEHRIHDIANFDFPIWKGDQWRVIVGKEILTRKLKGILALRAEVREGPSESGLPNEGHLH
jgi:hypothetical protein